jgi:hypothetical protein
MMHAGQIMEPKMLPMIYNYGLELVCLKSQYYSHTPHDGGQRLMGV